MRLKDTYSRLKGETGYIQLTKYKINDLKNVFNGFLKKQFQPV